MQGRRGRGADSTAVVVGHVGDLGRGGLGQPGGRLPGRCGQRHVGRPTWLIRQHRKQFRHGRRLAGARTAGQHGGPAPRRIHGGVPLRVGRRWIVTRRDQAGCGGPGPGQIHDGWRLRLPGQQIRTDLTLLLPVPVQVEQPTIQPHRHSRPAERAAAQHGEPLGSLRSRKVRRRVRHSGGIEAGGAAPSSPDQQGEREPCVLARFAGQNPAPVGDMHVSQVECADLVPGTEQTGGRPGQQYGPIVACRRTRRGRGHGRPRSSSAERSVTRSAGGRHPNTPAGTSSVTGVPGPAIPRTNRYSAPPRCVSGA